MGISPICSAGRAPWIEAFGATRAIRPVPSGTPQGCTRTEAVRCGIRTAHDGGRPHTRNSPMAQPGSPRLAMVHTRTPGTLRVGLRCLLVLLGWALVVLSGVTSAQEPLPAARSRRWHD